MPNGLKRVFLTALDDNSSTDKEDVGTIRFEGNKIYKYIQYDNGTANITAASGLVVGYFGASGYNDGIVTQDVSDTVGLGAGVLQAALTDQYYGWIQIKGPATLAGALTAGADGNALTLVGAGDGKLDVSALVSDAIVAFADDASAFEIACDFPF